MRRRVVLLIAFMPLLVAGYVFLQTVPPTPRLSNLMPSGALLYLEARDFGELVRDWDTSPVKAAWLQSDNYSVFSRSNLFTKLEIVYSQCSDAAGFLPGLKGVAEIAGSESALALYGIREVEFLYISHIPEAEILKSQLWAVRTKFEQRQAGGIPFYVRTDMVSKQSIAFAFSGGLLLLGTRDDLVAQALEKLAGGSGPSLASEPWYRDATAASAEPGELRMVLNLELLVKSVYFRSYWIQRNVSTLRRYWTGLADASRSEKALTETRVFLRAPGTEPPTSTDSQGVGRLLSLVPPDAGFYKAWVGIDSSAVEDLIVEKLIGRQPPPRDSRYAPSAISSDSHVGSEADLETRINEQPLPSGPSISDSVGTVRTMVEKGAPRALLLVQSSSPASGTFYVLPCVIVMEGAADWDPALVRRSITSAVGNLWTTSLLGAGWAARTVGRHPVESLNGLGTLIYANRGRLLFISNDATLLAAMLDRVGTSPVSGSFTYAAGFRHSRERSNYDRIMQALDFTTASSSAGAPQFGTGSNRPAFFSENIASLSKVLSQVVTIDVTEEEKMTATVQRVVYTVAR